MTVSCVRVSVGPGNLTVCSTATVMVEVTIWVFVCVLFFSEESECHILTGFRQTHTPPLTRVLVRGHIVVVVNSEMVITLSAPTAKPQRSPMKANMSILGKAVIPVQYWIG